MTIEQRIAILMAAIARANIRAVGMQSENIQRVHLGQSIAYGEHAFVSLIGEEGLEPTQVMRWLEEGKP